MRSDPGTPPDHGAARSGAPALWAEAVSKRYGDVTALDGVDLEVRSGECVALVGESGSGKTTLLRLFNRTVVPDRGSVRVAGRPVEELDPVALRRSVGYVQQEGGLLPHWTVERNAALVPWLRGDPEPRRKARGALERAGLAADAFAHRWPRELSGGQRQRVALARALAHEPPVILLDEPFGALDAITRTDLQEAFRGLIGALGITALLVTHDLHEALLLGDRVAVLRHGRVERFATAEELLRDPGPDYVVRLLERARVTGAPG